MLGLEQRMLARKRESARCTFDVDRKYQRAEHRAADLAALRELTRILRDISVVEGTARRAAQKSVEHEQALPVEGRAIYVSRTRRR